MPPRPCAWSSCAARSITWRNNPVNVAAARGLPLLILTLLLTLPTLSARSQASRTLTGRVVGVADGDTLTVLVDNRQVRVRLHGIDCPESRQPWGSRAQEFTSSAVRNREARVEVRDTDRYGRTVGVVWLHGDRTPLNRQLVEQGLAWAYRRYSTEYVPQEDAARRARRGLWADANPTPPWEFRRP